MLRYGGGSGGKRVLWVDIDRKESTGWGRGNSRGKDMTKGSVGPWLCKIAPKWRIVGSGVMDIRGRLLSRGSTGRNPKQLSKPSLYVVSLSKEL